jgi:hypothetical protein
VDRWSWGRIAGGAAARKGALGLGGEEFALRVIGERDHGCGQGGKTQYCSFGSIAGLPIVMTYTNLRN